MRGNNSFKASTGSYTLVVAKGATFVAVTPSQTSYAGQPIEFAVSVSTQSGGVAPTGTVQLVYDSTVQGSTVLGTATLSGSDGSSSVQASATATISTANLPPGTVPLQVVYLGDGNYAGSSSQAVSITGKPAFRIDSVVMSLPNGNTGYASLPLTSEGGYVGTVKLTCTLLSRQSAADPPACEMEPASVSLAANGKVLVKMLLLAKGAASAGESTAGSGKQGGRKQAAAGQARLGQIRSGGAEISLAGMMAKSEWGLGALVTLLLLWGVPARRRGRRALLSVLLLFALFSGFSACGGSGEKITAGEYRFQVTGVDSQDATTQATATVSVQVD